MVETSEGGYWVATSGGLSRFDSATSGSAKLLRHQLPGSVYAQELKLLFLDREGDVWAGTYRGLFRLAKSGSAFERVDVDPAAAQCDSTWKPSCGAVGIKALMEDRQAAWLHRN
jgi:ligand-binding sensor domain-containing protein